MNMGEIEMYKGAALDLKTLIEYSADSTVSKTLIDTKAGTITLFAFDAGQGLSEHAQHRTTRLYRSSMAMLRLQSEVTLCMLMKETWSSCPQTFLTRFKP
jgi:hypothetical protein